MVIINGFQDSDQLTHILKFTTCWCIAGGGHMSKIQRTGSSSGTDNHEVADDVQEEQDDVTWSQGSPMHAFNDHPYTLPKQIKMSKLVPKPR